MADGSYRQAGAAFRACAFDGWKRDFCHLAATLQAPLPRRFSDLTYAGPWQPRGRGRSRKPTPHELVDIREWFRTRAAYVDKDKLEELNENRLKVTYFSGMMRRVQHPYYCCVRVGDDIVGLSIIKLHFVVHTLQSNGRLVRPTRTCAVLRWSPTQASWMVPCCCSSPGISKTARIRSAFAHIACKFAQLGPQDKVAGRSASSSWRGDSLSRKQNGRPTRSHCSLMLGSTLQNRWRQNETLQDQSL